MVFPLIALGIGIALDFLFQYYFDEEEKKREEQYLAQGYDPRDVGGAVGFRQEEEFEGGDMDDGASYLRSQLFG